MIRAYALLVGIALLLLVLADIIFTLNDVTPFEDALYVGTGGIFLYTSRQKDLRTVREIVNGIGWLYLLIGTLVFLLYFLLGIDFKGNDFIDDTLHMVFGILNISIARYLI